MDNKILDSYKKSMAEIDKINIQIRNIENQLKQCKGIPYFKMDLDDKSFVCWDPSKKRLVFFHSGSEINKPFEEHTLKVRLHYGKHLDRFTEEICEFILSLTK